MGTPALLRMTQLIVGVDSRNKWRRWLQVRLLQALLLFPLADLLILPVGGASVVASFYCRRTVGVMYGRLAM